MPNPRRKLTAEQRKAKRERKQNSQMIFINGRQKWVRRPHTVEGLPVDEFVDRNTNPIWLHQEGLWELMQPYDEV